MKTNQSKHIILALFLFIGCISCVEEEYIHKVVVTDRVPVECSLQFATTPGDKINNTKATSEDERFLTDLRVYVFDDSSEGKLIGYKKYTGLKPNEYGLGTLDKINTISGYAYIYAIANMNSSQYYMNDDDTRLLDVDINKVSESHLTRGQFLQFNFERQLGEILPLDNRFFMSGYIDEGNRVVIDEKGNIKNSAGVDDHEIKLYRVVSKNIFKIQEGNSNIQFKLNGYRLYHVAKGGTLLPLKNNETTTNEVENLAYEPVTADNNQIEFYLPENRKTTNAEITAWKEREKDSYDSGTREFTKAPAESSYIVLYGDYLNATDKQMAKVEYTIHLGDFNTLTNFFVNRNYSYTYTITIKGVNDIIAEATVTTNNNPYAEGLVIDFQRGQVYELDAHYESRLMYFYQHDQQAGYLVYFKTPFAESKNLWVTTEGVYDLAGSSISPLCSFEGGKVTPSKNILQQESMDLDYQWVHFIENTEDNKIDAFDDLKRRVCKYNPDNQIDVFSLLYKLLTDPTVYKYSDSKGKFAVFTCFVDENYYANKPWGDFVNQPDRMMQIANEMFFSTDHESQYAKVAYTVNQKPIYTFYNPALSGNIVAYGVESVQEENLTDKVYTPFQYDLRKQDDWDGCGIAYGNLPDISWYEDLTASNPTGQDLGGSHYFYNSIAKACMTRNRDLDGDGIIQQEEVRWYLPTVNQLVGLWMGENILPAETRLFNISTMKEFANSEDFDTFAKYHLYTASQRSIFWPEEGISTSSVDAYSHFSKAQKIRCVRTLQSNGLGIKDNQVKRSGIADEYFTVENNNEGKVISLTRIHPDALRGYNSAPLPSEHERMPQNQLYSKFLVNKDVLKKNNYTDEQFSYDRIMGVSSESDVCSRLNGNWRVPNQRELALILAATPEYADQQLWSNSLFSGNFYGKNAPSEGQRNLGYKSKTVNGKYFNYGFVYLGPSGGKVGNITVEADVATYFVRCVRDIK